MPVDTRHPCSQERMKQWRRIRTFMAGVDAVKEAKTEYLPRLPGQKRYVVPEIGLIDEYNIYLDRAKPDTEKSTRAIDGMVGMVSRKSLHVEAPDAVEEIMDNVTLDGMSLNDVAKELVREHLQTRWGGIYVDYSTEYARPFVRYYPAESIMSWQFKLRDGLPFLSQVVLYEPTHEADPKDAWASIEVKQYRVVVIDDAGAVVSQVYRCVKANDGTEKLLPFGEPVMPLRNDVPLVAIPFVAIPTTWKLKKPPVLELIDLIAAHYKNSADYENGIHFTGVATLSIWGLTNNDLIDPATQKQIELGPGRLIAGANPAGHAEWVMTGGQGCAEIAAAMESKERAMQIALARLLLSEEQRHAQTAESLRVAFAADDATLSDVVTDVESALVLVVAWCQWWMSTDATVHDSIKQVSVKINRDYIDSPMPVADLAAIGLEVDGGRMAPQTAYYLRQRGELTRPDVSFEDEMADIAAYGTSQSSAMDTTTMSEVKSLLADIAAARASGDDAGIAAGLAEMQRLLGDMPAKVAA